MAEKETCYVEVVEPSVHARFGKLYKGRHLLVDAATAERWKNVGLAKDSTEAKHKKFQDDRQKALDERYDAGVQATQDSALWDVATHRDVLTAPEEGLKRALEAGVPLVNVDRLTTVDDEGRVVPLKKGATLSEMLDARLHMGDEDPLHGHERSSVQGGGSHFYADRQEQRFADTKLNDDKTEAPRRGRPARKPTMDASRDKVERDFGNMKKAEETFAPPKDDKKE